jgi:hypothetical protein
LLAISSGSGQVVGRDLDAKMFLELEETCHVERLRIGFHVLQDVRVNVLVYPTKSLVAVVIRGLCTDEGDT